MRRSDAKQDPTTQTMYILEQGNVLGPIPLPACILFHILALSITARSEPLITWQIDILWGWWKDKRLFQHLSQQVLDQKLVLRQGSKCKCLSTHESFAIQWVRSVKLAADTTEPGLFQLSMMQFHPRMTSCQLFSLMPQITQCCYDYCNRKTMKLVRWWWRLWLWWLIHVGLWPVVLGLGWELVQRKHADFCSWWDNTLRL